MLVFNYYNNSLPNTYDIQYPFEMLSACDQETTAMLTTQDPIAIKSIALAEADLPSDDEAEDADFVVEEGDEEDEDLEAFDEDEDEEEDELEDDIEREEVNDVMMEVIAQQQQSKILRSGKAVAGPYRTIHTLSDEDEDDEDYVEGADEEEEEEEVDEIDDDADEEALEGDDVEPLEDEEVLANLENAEIEISGLKSAKVLRSKKIIASDADEDDLALRVQRMMTDSASLVR